ncbi:MAG: CBS domain-containing protein, partial [Planctomycetota bacterium]|nr:CBS domain-containing protein [Planctomycetota bacterium]
RNESVRKILSSDPISVHTGQKLSEGRQLLEKHGIHHLPVTSGDKLVGILSSNDFLSLEIGGLGADTRSLDSYLDHQFTIDGVMKKDLHTLPASGTVRDAAQVLADGNFHSVPVVEDDNRLVGIVTSVDLIKYLLDQY